MIIMDLKPVKILKAVVVICVVLAVALAVASPRLVAMYAEFKGRTRPAQTAVLISYILSTFPALVALFSMLRILKNIGEKRPFDSSSLTYLNVISWCCVAIAAVCAVGGYWFLSLYAVSAAMMFLFLVVRVVSACFKAAAELQAENDLTI